jgi:ribosomal protein L11
MSSLAPKLGPLGMSPKKVGDDVQKATKDWKGLKVLLAQLTSTAFRESSHTLRFSKGHLQNLHRQPKL